MLESENRGAFDKLVAGISREERSSMLDKLNQNSTPAVQLSDNANYINEPDVDLHLRYTNESIFYKLLLWFRSLLKKNSPEELYNEDLVAGIARRINRDHPGLINHHNGYLDSFFFDRLKSLKDSADFFKPYMANIEANPGEFYVFLSSFVTPDISDAINKNADPFINPFTKDPGNELKTELMRKLDSILNNLNLTSKAKLYEAVGSVNWMQHFCTLPFLHFTSLFTNIIGGSYTCPYKTARTDFESFAAIFADPKTIQTETLEAVFLFSAKKSINKNVQTKDIEHSVKEFLSKANSNLSLIQMFINSVPVVNLGKVVEGRCDWHPDTAPGAEAWFQYFRNHWRKIIDIRWKEWLRERKKALLSDKLKSDFGLTEFPTMLYKPWEQLFMTVPFNNELTGGFLSWFAVEQFNECIGIMNEVMLEGIFIRSENRVEYSEAVNSFNQANKDMLDLLDRLAPEGDYGSKFQEINDSQIRSLQNQNSVDNMMKNVEHVIRRVTTDFMESSKHIAAVYSGFFEEKRDGEHETLQNWMNIKGHENRAWRDHLGQVYKIVKDCVFYLSELEPIDAALSTK